MKIGIRKTGVIYLLSFLLPIFVILSTIFLLKIFPFGDKSFLYWDSQIQYINFYSYLKSTIFTNNNLLYSLSNLGGNNMLDFSAYYNFFSPFNIIFFFCPDEYLNIALEFLMILKIGLCSLTFSYFLNNEVKYSRFSILISTSYALSMHVIITTLSNFILMDGIIFLPLVILGVSKIIKENNSKLYLLSLFLTILTNAYMGYVSILFSIIFFIYKSIIIKFEFNKVKKFILSTAIATGLCAWFLIPVIYSLPDGKYNYFNMLNNLLETKVYFLEVLSRFYTGTLEQIFWKDRIPYLFVGILPISMTILCFFNKAYTKKERLIDGILTLFLFSGFFINLFFIIWSMGVLEPNGTIYRYSHIFLFFILYLSYKELVKIKATKIKGILYAFFIFELITILVYIQHYKDAENVLFIIDSIFISFLLLGLLLAKKLKSFKGIFLFFLISLHILNLSIHAKYVYNSQKSLCVVEDINDFKEHKIPMKNALNAINNFDKGLYRIASEETFIKPQDRKIYNNSSFLNSYNSITGYSSLGKTEVRDFYYKLGIPVFMGNMLFSYTDNMQNLPLSFMGVKYIISSNNNLRLPYKKIKKVDNLNIYQNPYSFPMAFLIENNLSDIDFNAIPDFQNKIVKILLNNDYENIYKYKKARNYNSINMKNAYLLLNSEVNIGYFIDKIIIGNKEYKINDLNTNIFYLGDIKNNFYMQYILYKYLFRDEHLLKQFDRIESNLVEENLEVLEKYSRLANKNPCNLEKITSSHFKGNIKALKDNQALFVSMPYDKGWKIKVNDKKMNNIKKYNSMLLIPLQKGNNEIDMKYIPRGFYLGLFITIISALLILLI